MQRHDHGGEFMETTVELVSRGPGKRRYRTLEEKRQIVEETLASETSVAIMARRHGVNANQLFHWRKLYQAGLLGSSSSEAEVGGVRLLPVTVANQPEQRTQEATHAESSAGAIHIEFPGRALVSVEGHADTAVVRAVLESLRG
jgi:transposase